MSEYDTFTIDGHVLRTGCLVSEVRTFSAAPLTESVQAYSHADLLEIITDSSFVDARQAFPPEKFIFNQGQVGSCNFYAGKGCLMRSRESRGHKYVELSAEFGYANVVDGRDQGSSLDSSMRWISREGLPPMRPQHHQKYRKRDFTPEDYAAASRFKGVELYEINSELELATAIVKGFFCNIAVHVGRNFTKVDSKGRVQGDSGKGNHAICVHGIKVIDGQIEFDHAGSWGRRMHQDGYGYLNWRRNGLGTTKKYHPFWAIRAVGDDPMGDNPDLK